MYEYNIMKIKLTALSPNTTQGRFSARAAFDYDEFIPCRKLTKLFTTIQSDETDVPVLLAFVTCFCYKKNTWQTYKSLHHSNSSNRKDLRSSMAPTKAIAKVCSSGL